MRIELMMINQLRLLLLRHILPRKSYSLDSTRRNCTKLKLLSLCLLKVYLAARRTLFEEIRMRVRLGILHRIFPAIRILTRMHC